MRAQIINILIGLGLPWTLSAIVWAIKGADDEWRQKYAHLPHVLEGWPNGAFVVESGDLGFSVLIFIVCALLTIVCILLRRPAELGGGTAGKYATAVFFVSLWLVYVTLSVLATENMISVF